MTIVALETNRAMAAGPGWQRSAARLSCGTSSASDAAGGFTLRQSARIVMFTACLVVLMLFGASIRAVADDSVLTGWAPSWQDSATTPIGGETFDLNAFLGADRYYQYSTPITGQNTITFNLEAGHFWNGHETLQHVATNTTNFVNAPTTFGGSAIEPKFDRHATEVAMLIGGRETTIAPQIRQQGLAPGTDLRSAAIAAGWNSPAYALSFSGDSSTVQFAYAAAFGTADVINSSYNFTDQAGTNSYTILPDAESFANATTLYVISAGNSGPGSNTVGGPASGYNALTVAALAGANTFDTVASFSSRGPQNYGYVGGATVTGVRAAVDLAAPGSSITSAFYGGQTGGNNVSLTNSTDQGSDPDAYATVSGTSFAAPIVAGGASLVASAAKTLSPLSSNPAASESMVIKALLQTGAAKTNGWNNGQTSVTVGTTTYIETTQSLDWAVGAGRLDLDTTFDVQLTGQTDVAGTSTGVQGSVDSLGWDYGNAVLLTDNDYLLPVLETGTSFTATLAWMRNRSGSTVSTAADVAQADLNLSLWLLDDSDSFTTLVARSASLYNTVEHFSLPLTTAGRYGLRVEYPVNSFDLSPGATWGSVANPQAYGLAWNSVSPVPEPATWVLAGLGLSGLLLYRRGAGSHRVFAPPARRPSNDPSKPLLANQRA